MPRVLVVDDELNLRTAIAAVFRSCGYVVDEGESGEACLDRYARNPADAVVLDLMLPGLSGLEVLKLLRERDRHATVVMITAYGSVPSAVEAMRSGAYDYLAKPFDNDDLILKVNRALEHRRLISRVAELEDEVTARAEFAGIVGRSPAIQHVLGRLAKVARSDVTVLFTGETGTGKDLAARSLHQRSARATDPFVAVNCGAIPATLAEDELFGHCRGAFTDARQDRKGRFEQADGGTLFLDEVGELPPDVQVKLLRAIQEHEVYRIGADAPVRIDVRLIVATNRELPKDVAAGRFRSDLYWRLNVFQIEMPPLRQRREDLPLLISHLLDRVNLECRTAVDRLAPEVQELLASYGWPGNVRELANVLKHGAIMAEGSTLTLECLPEYLLDRDITGPSAMSVSQNLSEALAETERRLVTATLERFKGNQSAAAAALGIDRRTLYSKLKQYRTDEREPS